MDFIKFLISYFLEGNETVDTEKVLSSLGGNFNLQGLISALPTFLNLFKNDSSNNIKSDSVNTEPLNAFSPIVNVADKDIIYSLNKYFSAN